MQQVVTKQPVYNPGSVWNKTNPNTPAPTTTPLPASPSCQPCPACGGLDCLCRPRFFAGQLLSEQDLNRLDQYILAKNRLHNRYLVGHGVVCGLQVTCSPCGNTVSVAPGYAIDPCGNDIIVCSPDTVDVCSLINACTPSTQVNCGPYKDNSACSDTTQTWILAISYLESPSRGITPLTGSGQCGCATGGTCTCGGTTKSSAGCTCGGAVTGYGCSCGSQAGTATQPMSTNRPRRGAPSTCEPVVTCETYRYEVFPAPAQITRNKDTLAGGLAGLASTVNGAMFANIACCLQNLVAGLPAMPTDLQDRVAWANYCCALRLALIRYAVAQGGNDCEAIAKLRAIDCPSANSQRFYYLFAYAFIEMIIIGLEFMLQCFCINALPPCAPAGDPRVPLASVTVQTGTCTVVSVCNWTTLRKHVVTNLTLGYWLGWLPIVPMIRTFMQQACCAVFNLPSGFYHDPAVGDSEHTNAETTGASPDLAKDDTNDTGVTLNQPLNFASTTYSASNPISDAVVSNLAGPANSLTFQDLADAMFKPLTARDNEDLAATPHAKVLAEVSRPLLNAFGPLFTAASGGSSTLVNADDLKAMRAEIDTLKTTVATQQTTLDALHQQTPKQG